MIIGTYGTLVTRCSTFTARCPKNFWLAGEIAGFRSPSPETGLLLAGAPRKLEKLSTLSCEFGKVNCEC